MHYVEKQTPSDPFDYLYNLTPEQLEDWIAVFLKYGISSPFVVVVKGDLRSEVFRDEIWNAIESDWHPGNPAIKQQLKRRIKNAIHSLIASWTPPSDSPRYMSELVLLAGDLNVLASFDILLELAAEHTLENVGDGFDLQRELLGVVFGIVPRKSKRRVRKLRRLLKYYIDRPGYSAVCFEKYWTLHPINGVRFIRNYVKSSMNDPYLAFASTLVHFHSAMGPSFFKDHFLAIRRNLLRTSGYRTSAIAASLYKRYLQGIKELCTISYEVGPEFEHEPSLASLVSGTARSASRKAIQGFSVEWHPPYRPDECQTFYIEALPTPLDIGILNLLRPPPRMSLQAALA